MRSRSSPTLTGRSRRVVAVPRRGPPPSGPAPRGVRILRGQAAPVDLELDPQARYLLGRHDAADIGFDDEAVSRLHGVLRPGDEGWVFEDYGSSNGTTVLRDGAASTVGAHQVVPVAAGDVLELGSEGARIELLEEPPPPPAERSSDDTAVSSAARSFEAKMDLAARTRVPVFLLGPSGCGKTHSARQIHLRSSSKGAFVPINCARLPTDASALHSELLGHVKGAFTGADAPRTGKLVHADGGTLFLDEVESLSPLAQGFLLDVLEGTGDLAPLGAGAPRLKAPIFRLISASKAPLGESDLRDDLCERLAEGHMWRVPTLAERADDIPGLIARFAREQSSLLGVKIELHDAALSAAQAASWPGQIRQLRATVNVLSQVAVARLPLGEPWPEKVVISRGALEDHLEERAEAFGTGALSSLGVAAGAPPLKHKADARALTAEHVAEILEACAGNRSEAARKLGIARNTLARKIKEFGLS